MSEKEIEKKKDYTIIINGEKKEVSRKRLSYTDIISLAFTTPPTGENILFTITYDNGPPPNLEGSMIEGDHVIIDDGMIFNVTATDKS